MALSGSDKRLVDDIYEAWCQQCPEEAGCLSRSGIREWCVEHVLKTGHDVRMLHQQVREYNFDNTGHLTSRYGRMKAS